MSLCKELRTELRIVSTRLQTVMKSASLLMGTWVHTQPPPQGPANESRNEMPVKWRLSPRGAWKHRSLVFSSALWEQSPGSAPLTPTALCPPKGPGGSHGDTGGCLQDTVAGTRVLTVRSQFPEKYFSQTYFFSCFLFLTTQWAFVYSQGCKTITTINCRTFYHSRKKFHTI